MSREMKNHQIQTRLLKMLQESNIQNEVAGFKFTKKKKSKKKHAKRKAAAVQQAAAATSAIIPSKRPKTSSSSSTVTTSFTSSSTSSNDSLVPKYPTVKPQEGSIRNVSREDPATALNTCLTKLVRAEEKAIKRQFVGMNSFIYESASACSDQFLAAMEDRMNQKREEHLIVQPEQLVNPENVRLEQQQNQLEILAQRLGTEVAAWQTQSNEEWNPSMNTNAVEEADAKEAEAYEQNADNDTEKPFERMSSKIMKMTIQVEQIQHALEQSKRTVTTAETKRMQLSARVHTAGKYSKKSANSLIRGFLG